MPSHTSSALRVTYATLLLTNDGSVASVDAAEVLRATRANNTECLPTTGTQ